MHRLDKRETGSYRYRDLMPHECFADEIAIDFPSVGHVVDRMRDAFLGERVDAGVVSAEVCLSREDAWHGLIVPLDVPIRGLCPRCGGRGETWTEPCERCCGTGDSLFQHSVRLAVPARRGRRAVPVPRELRRTPAGLGRSARRHPLGKGIGSLSNRGMG